MKVLLPLDPANAGKVLAWTLPTKTRSFTECRNGNFFYDHQIVMGRVGAVRILVSGVHFAKASKVKKWDVSINTVKGEPCLKLRPHQGKGAVMMNGFAIAEDGQLRVLPLLRTPQQGIGQAGIRQAVIRAEVVAAFG